MFCREKKHAEGKHHGNGRGSRRYCYRPAGRRTSWNLSEIKKRNKEIPVHFTLHIRKMYVINIQKAGIPAAIVQGIMSVSFFVSLVRIIFADIFRGFGNGNFSMYLALICQVILLIPNSAYTSPDIGCGYGKLMRKHL